MDVRASVVLHEKGVFVLLSLECLDGRELVGMAREQFGASGESLEFVPLGEDSWSYRLGDLWVSVRRDLRGHFPASYEAARIMKDAGLDFVLAPLRGLDGKVSHTIGGFPVVVFPYVSAVSVDTISLLDHEVDELVRMMGQVHGTLVSGDLPREDYRISFAEDIAEALAAVRRPAPSGGPFGIRMHALLRKHAEAIAGMVAELDRIGEECAASDDPFVITHGEPGAPNILRGEDGFLFADWGEMMWGPAERDWFHFARTLGRTPRCRPQFMRFYELRWALNEISEYAGIFLGEHADDAETQAMWRRLLNYLPEVG
ncbi:aminoglycoside phosphotransferase family protein [Kitasatospora aureofaciens]|uniref:aminoglycoside phosphotransferase family protein n=1 Tax=Kitasatospora aureofaciens TaxID=1894 RepID=UPI0037C9E1AC